MKTEQQVWTALVDSNPVPDVDRYGREQVGRTTHLATLDQGNAEMTQQPTRQEGTDERKARPLVWLAAAAAAVLLGAVLLFNTQGNEETPPATDPVPTTVDEPVPTTTPEATPTTTIDPAEAAWEAVPIWNGSDISGEVRSINFIPEFTMTIPPGSDQGCPPNSRITDVEAPGVPEGPIAYPALRFSRMEFGSVEDTASTLIESAGISVQTAVTEIAGAEGVTFDVVGQESQEGFWAAEGSCSLSWAQGDHWRFWVVEVAGEITTLSLNAQQEGFEETLAIYQPIIDSIVWREIN